MTMTRTALPLVAFALMSLGAVAMPFAQQAAESIVVPFSDPARPGAIRVLVHSGGVVVKGANRRDVAVLSRDENGAGRGRRQAPAGLRLLSQGTGLTITEENNQMSVTATNMKSDVDIELQVPSRVNLKLTTHNNGDLVLENVEGEIEATNHNGAIRMTGVAGSVVADTHNGDVRVVLTRIAGDRPMAFLSYNGDIDVTLPAAAKANLKLRSDNGEIFTDFDVQMRAQPAPQTTRSGSGRTRIEVNNAIYGAINGGGPEFEFRTYNGDIFVRKGAQ